MKVTIHASRQYDIEIAKGSITTLPQILNHRYSRSKIMLITDEKVKKYHGNRLRALLNNFPVEQFVLPDGESSKSTENVVRILEYLAEKAFRRNDVLLAFGGGVIGDITGLCASLYLRGIDFIQIPTTFLAAIDSSVGGKTAVNLSHGKNLMGTFYQPAHVIIDRSFFETLEDSVFEDGVAEAIKYGMIRSETLFSLLEQQTVDKYSSLLDDIIRRCVKIKRDVVNADEFDRGIRQILNYGHTFGHAFELVSGFSMSHGRAVACGMKRMVREFAKDSAYRVEQVLSRYHLSVPDDFDTDQVMAACRLDKKSRAEEIHVVICEKIGQASIQTVDFSTLKNIYERTRDASNY